MPSARTTPIPFRPMASAQNSHACPDWAPSRDASRTTEDEHLSGRESGEGRKRYFVIAGSGSSQLTIRRRANCYPRDDEEAKQTPLNQAVGGRPESLQESDSECIDKQRPPVLLSQRKKTAVAIVNDCSIRKLLPSRSKGETRCPLGWFTPIGCTTLGRSPQRLLRRILQNSWKCVTGNRSGTTPIQCRGQIGRAHV